MIAPVTSQAYAAFGEADLALRDRYGPPLDAALAKWGVEPTDFGVLMAVYAWELRPAEAWMFGLRGPYTNTDVYAGWLSGAANRGLLDETFPGGYRLSARGREAHDALLAAARDAMEVPDPDRREPLERLAQLLKRLVEACLSAPPPPEKWCVVLSHAHALADDAPVMGRIDQWITDLRSFRDDAHLAAWRALGVSAPALEALTFLWQGVVESLDQVCERLARRGHDRGVYVAALAELRARDWIAGSDDAPRLTGDGREVRVQIEARTDELFFRPWAALAESEIEDARALALNARDALRAAGAHD